MSATCEPKTWLLDRYARFVPSAKKNQGEWKYFSSYGCKDHMKISIVEPLKLLITSGSLIALESIPLYGPDKEPCTKAIHKGNSMLFFCKSKDNVRRFRVQFAKGPTATSERDNCQDFLQAISKYVQVKTIENQDDESNSQAGSQSLLDDASQQSQMNSSMEYLPPNKTTRTEILDSKIFSAKSIRQIAESLMTNTSSHSSESCNSDSMSLTDKDIDSLVKSCMLDPGFPSFVGQVEKSLKRLISE